jgi:hypothetical protein
MSGHRFTNKTTIYEIFIIYDGINNQNIKNTYENQQY